MKKSKLLLILVAAGIIAGCVKSEIDLNKVSGNISLSPSVVIAAVKGVLTLGDLIESTDTLVIGTDNSIKLVFKQDSILDFALGDFYESFPATDLAITFPLAGGLIVNEVDTLYVDPGNGMKIKTMDVVNGEVSYTLTSWCTFDTEIHLLFNTITSGGTPLTSIIPVVAGGTATGSIDLSGHLIDLSTNVSEPYNQLPIVYNITASGSPSFVPSDSLKVAVSFAEPEFDYITGYFGENSVDSEKDTIDTGMEEFFSRLTGSIELTNPKITVNYDNSFGIPMRVTADVVGENSTETINLDRAPVDLDHPVSESIRDISSSFTIDRTNSTLPELVSMLPERVILGGSASANPDGETGTDNIIFGDSRFIAGVEIEVPFEFRINDLQLSDTLDNFLLDEENGESPLDMLSQLRVDFYLENGFPLGGDITLALYDSLTATIVEQISTAELFSPAPVDAQGRVTAPSIQNSSIEFTTDFLAAVDSADKIIFTFTLYTTNHGTVDVKIYSDYSILFKAGLFLKADIDLSQNK